MVSLFESRWRRYHDDLELRQLSARYGDEMLEEIGRRAQNRSLKTRDRRHWKRLYRKAKKRQKQEKKLFDF